MINIILNNYFSKVNLFKGKILGLLIKGTHNNLIINNGCKIINYNNLIIGDNVTIGHHSDLQAFSSKIIIGNNVWIGHHADIQAFDEDIVIGKDVEIGPYVSILASNHIFKDFKKLIRLQGKKSEKIIIEENTWIGTKAVILAGVKIGRGSVVGAGAVITTNIPPNSVAVGVPARVLKKRHV